MTLSLRQYKIISLLVVVVLAAAISQFFFYKKFLFAIMAVAFASSFMFYLRSKIKNIIADERDYSIAGKSARWAIQFFAWIGVLVMFFFYSKGMEMIAQTLAYSICFIMISYSIIFRFLNKYEK